ncbi:uncharacterized protein LOC117241072 [Bombus vosnesenskii]|uniref:Uncharacterized protein LOC117241072 n=1 Tax=Bombus vosnesenskii TaxID=207650 RepID=A0A6J3LCN4_9HYME|nr:uncharacterized protein LOC117241072 [Bombus vosnesenskii]XP_033362945.1 uncharacterized protein LOC117241072 [Bombus vosnesenskii]
MTVQDGRSFYNSNPSTLSLLLGTATWCAFGIFWFFVTCLTLVKTTSTYPRIFLVAALTVSIVSGSVFRNYSLKFGSRLLVTASVLMYIFRCYDWLPRYLLPSIPSYCRVLCFAKLDP